MGKHKPSGLRAGRKLKTHRREEKWSSKKYNKSHSLTAMKANPLGGSCMSKGIVVEKIGLEAKQPNSAIRKGVRVQLIKVRLLAMEGCCRAPSLPQILFRPSPSHSAIESYTLTCFIRPLLTSTLPMTTERKEDRCLRSPGWLPQLRRRERRGAHCWFRKARKVEGRYPRLPLQGGQGGRCVSYCSLQGQEGEAQILNYST